MKSMKRQLNPNKVIAYVRASTNEQRLGPEAQEKAIRDWCKVNKVKLIRTFSDLGVSGGVSLEKRPGLMDAINALRSEDAGVLLICKRDRIARDVIIAAMTERVVEKQGARIKSVDGNGNGESPEALLMRRMIDAFAEYERAIIRARTKAALAVKRSKGEFIGEVPFGFSLARDGIKLKKNHEEQKTIKRVFILKSEGHTYNKIVQILNSKKIPARGRCWHVTSVRRIFIREIEKRNQRAHSTQQ